MPSGKRKRGSESPESASSPAANESDLVSGSDGFSNDSEAEESLDEKREATDVSRNGKSKDTSTREGASVGQNGVSTASETSSTAKEVEMNGAAQAPTKTFADLGIIPQLVEATVELGFKKPTPIQSEAIPIALTGRDMIGLAETGSGKTAAFALPILQSLMAKPQAFFALVLAPTRELAYQTAQQFSALGSLIAVRTVTLVGGMPEMDQSIALSRQQPHVVIATPGRLLWHLQNTKGFTLRNLKYLVLDEADRLLDMNFGEEIKSILQVLPPNEARHTYLFSATMSSGVESLQRLSLRKPARVSIYNKPVDNPLAKHGTVATLVQHWLLVPQKRKDLYLVYLLSGIFAGHSAIVFARTVNEVGRVTLLLRALGLAAIPLHGHMSQSSRLGSLAKFKAKRSDLLVCTDVAARGLDIPSVDLVLNFDLPTDSTTYVHRVGRTARAGKSGRAVSFVSQYDVEVWLRIEKALGRQVDQLGATDGLDESEAAVLAERVAEAQREAVRKLRNGEGGTAASANKKVKGRWKGKESRKRERDERDREEV